MLSLFEGWTTSLSYTFQLYFDFSGYCDMAIGLALIFNIKLPINFNSPYKATNIQDFWRRWHITLSRFLRDYVYIPLGGNKKGAFRTYVNLLATFLIGGFWHGAGWTFIFWGFLHGVALVVHRFWSGLNIKINKAISWFITFNFVNIAWIFFRAKKWDDAINILNAMFFGDVLLQFLKDNRTNVRWIIVAIIAVLVCKNSVELLKDFKINKKTLLFTIVLLAYSLMSFNRITEFIYFKF